MAERGQAVVEAFKKFDEALAVARQALEDSMKCGCPICKR